MSVSTQVSKDKLREQYHAGNSVKMGCGNQPKCCAGVSMNAVLSREDYAWYNDRICFLLETPVICPECGARFTYAIIQNDNDIIRIYGAGPEPI